MVPLIALIPSVKLIILLLFMLTILPNCILSFTSMKARKLSWGLSNTIHHGFEALASKDMKRASVKISTITFERELPNSVIGYDKVSLPKLVFLPGLDGVGNYSSRSFVNLSLNYNVTRMFVSPSDRSTFTEVADAVIDELESYNESAVLMGESFGGLLATYVASRRKNLISKLVLINPATSFDRTNWASVGPIISNTGPAFPFVGIATLLATVVTPEQFQLIGKEIISRINSTEGAIKELNSLYQASQQITQLLPPATLQWRLSKWLSSGTYIMEGRYKNITTPTLLLIGSQDRLLPSLSEGRRLENEMINAMVPFDYTFII
jgi:pimeloyl-ACP methyl ester carboxylesterase